jgi:anaerobic selenocysteine-containing dehydrogenase
MNEADMKERGLRSGDVVEVRSGERVLSGLSIFAYPIASGCCAAYYPEANGLIGLEALDRQSGTPAYKSIAIEIRKLG